jgi:dTDP-glucose 4,6-dehydratase
VIFYVDIDETICTKSPDLRYENAQPMTERIERVNKLYDEGNTIIYWTARGTVTGIDWREVTEKQFRQWGVKYHELRFGKPAYDLFIDDKNINSERFFNE